MKRFLGMIGVAMTMVALAACGGGASDEPAGGNGAAVGTGNQEQGQTTNVDVVEPAGDAPAEIRVAWWGSQVRHDRTMEVIEMFMEQYPHITVQAEFYDSGGYWTALNTLIAANDVWDVFQLGSNFPEFRSHIRVLNDFVDSGLIDMSSTTQDFIDITSDGGEIVGISNGVNAVGFAYDPAMFEAAGVPLPHPWWTWSEFEAASLAIAESQGVWGISQFGTNPAVVLTQYMSQQGVEFWHEYDVNSLGFDDPAILVPFFEMWRNLVQNGAAADPGDAMLITDIEGDPIVTGQAAMTYIASNQFIALANAAAAHDPTRTLRMIPLPGHGEQYGASTNVVSSQMFSISTNSQYPEAAAAFINFFQNSIEANQILQGERGVPIMQHVRDVLEADADAVTAETYAFISLVSELSDGMGVILGNPSQGEVEDMIAFLMDQVVFDMVTPAQAAQDLFNFAQNVVSMN